MYTTPPPVSIDSNTNLRTASSCSSSQTSAATSPLRPCSHHSEQTHEDDLRPTSRRRYQASPDLKSQSSRSASVALDMAFSSTEPHPVILPTSLYRGSTSRSHSRPRSAMASPTMSPTRPERSSMDSSATIRSRLSLDQPSRDRSYSPMAAGFARLSRKDGDASASSESRRHGMERTGKSSLDLEARMFAGPA